MTRAGREPKVELLPVTQELLTLLEPLTIQERQDIFTQAEVPYAGLHAWRLGYYHPSSAALHRLFEVMGYRLGPIYVQHARV